MNVYSITYIKKFLKITTLDGGRSDGEKKITGEE